MLAMAGMAVASAAEQKTAETTWDLRTLYRLAMSHDPAWLAAARTAEADKQVLPLARSALWPQLNARAGRRKQDETLVTDPGGLTETTATVESETDSVSIDLEQVIFDAQVFAGLSQAQAKVLQAEAELRNARQDLILRTTQTYFDYLRAQDEHQLALAEEAALSEQAELAKARLKVGLAAVTETYEANARLALVQAQVIEKQILLDKARDQLQLISGQQVQSVVALRPDFVIPAPEPNDVSHWMQRADNSNALLVARQSSTEAARKEIERQRAGHYPTVNLSGERYKSNTDASLTTPATGSEYDNTEYTLELKLPLFQGGSTLVQTREARLRYEAEQQQLEQLKREVQRDTREAFHNVSSGKRKLAALDQSVKANESVVEAKRQGFRAGINTNQDVLDAQRDLFAARRDKANARYDTILAWLTLKKLAGSLDDEDLYFIGDAIR